MRRAALIALAAALAPTLSGLVAAPAAAQGARMAVDPDQGMTFDQARAEFPGLSRVTFDKFDPDADGVIAANKIPALQATYNVMYLNRH